MPHHLNEVAAAAATSSRLYTLYFIRHGEAVHNQIEKLAESKALSAAMSLGHDANSNYARRAAEEARRRALESIDMEDPPLSESGLEEARRAKRTLERLIEAHGLPRVEEVWVSPLQRAMQTAGAIFPESFALKRGGSSSSSSSSSAPSPLIRVRKEIEERQTGLACDKHTSYENIRRRLKFKKLSISCLKLDKLALGGKPSCSSLASEESGASSSHASESLERQGEEISSAATGSHRSIATVNLEVGEGKSIWEDKFVGGAATSALEAELRLSKSTKDDSHEAGGVVAIEDKSMLRERTKKLFQLLDETESQSICLIGHKGYLRELERGPLGYADADLFRNCEVRVYRLELETGRASRADDIGDGVSGSGGTVGSDQVPRKYPVLYRAEKIASSTTIR